jgi:hypothetical protein
MPTEETHATAAGSDEGGDPAMFLDTDGEAAFRNSGEWLRRHGIKPAHSATGTPVEAMTSAEHRSQVHMALRLPTSRRKRAEDVFRDGQEAADLSTVGLTTPRQTSPPLDDAPAQQLPPASPSSTGSLLHRLRTQSFQGFTRPFSSMRRRTSRTHLSSHSSVHSSHDPSWSSDSSSDDVSLGDRANHFHPSSLNIPSMGTSEYTEPFDEFA